MLKAGDIVDDFALLNHDQRSIGLADLTANGPAVLYFYIKAKTPG